MKNSLIFTTLRRTLYGIAAGVLAYGLWYLIRQADNKWVVALIIVIGILALIVSLVFIGLFIAALNDDSPQMEAVQLLEAAYPHLEEVPHIAIMNYMSEIPLHVWGVQIGAFKHLEFAKIAEKKLINEGKDAYIIYHNGYHKVRVGRFVHEEHAIILESHFRERNIAAFRVLTTNYDEFTANFGVWYENWKHNKE